MVTREQWAKSLLRWMDLPESKRNVIALIAWQAAEGGPTQPQARWNPLNTTMPWPGATVFNWVGVKNYANENDGLAATAATFRTDDAGYEAILNRLAKYSKPRRTMDAVEASRWGTGGLAKSIVDDVRSHFEQYASVAIGQ